MVSSIGSIGAIIVGAVLAAVTVLGVVNSQVNNAGSDGGNVNNPTSQINYGNN